MITDGENRALDIAGRVSCTPVKSGYLHHPAGFENAPLVEEMVAELSPEVLKIILFKGHPGGIFR